MNKQIKMKNYLTFLLLLIFVGAEGQVRDTLKLMITKAEKAPADTVYYFSSRVDTLALVSPKIDTSKMVEDKNTQDLTESKYEIKIKGAIRVNGYYDFSGMTSTEGFLPYDIPVGEQQISNLRSVYIGARQSRFAIDADANTKVGHIRTYMEVDFASSTSSVWRLRHAYAEWNFFKIGYTWSTFMDNASLPTTVDFEGPNSALNKRHGLVRYERKYGDNSIIGLSVETPASDYYNPADSLLEGRNKQGNFDLAGRYKRLHKWGHIQAAGIIRRIDYLKDDQIDDLLGWGLLFSAVVNLDQKNILYTQYSFGESIAHYYVGFSNLQLDAVYDPESGNMTKKFIQGGFLTYTHIFSPKWRFATTLGISYIELKDFEAPNSFKSSQYMATNIFFFPIETINVGLELAGGSRTNKDGESGDAARISMIAAFSF